MSRAGGLKSTYWDGYLKNYAQPKAIDKLRQKMQQLYFEQFIKQGDQDFTQESIASWIDNGSLLTPH